MAEVINLNMFGGETPQVSIMPTPSPELAGKIIQYAGATDENFTAGYFYRCVTTGDTSSWQRVNVQPSGAGTSWGGIDGDIADQTDLAEALNGKTGRLDVTFVVDTTEQLATKTAVMGDTAIVKTTGKMHTYGSTWDGGVNGEYGVIYIGENEQYVWDTTKFVLISTEDAKTLNGKDEGYFAKDSEAAKRNGSYPLMNVGSADNLTGGFKVSREFSEDTAGGSADIADGIVKIERIKGNSIVWRNLIPRMRVVDKAIENWVFSGGSTTPVVTETSNEITFTNASILQPLPSFQSALIVGRKYYWIVRAKSSNANNYVYCTPLRGENINPYGVADEWVTISAFGVAIINWGNDGIRFHQNGATNTTTIDKRIGMVLIDVSSIEESTGKEFQTKSDFESWLAYSGFENYFGYSAGEIFNLNPTAIKTVGFNAYNHTTGKAYVIGGNQYQITGAYTSITEDGVTITPDSNGKFTPTKNGELVIAGGDSTTTCVHLVWSGKRDGEYEEHWEEIRNIPVAQINTDGTITESAEGKTRLFPDGLRSAGSIHDDITRTKAIKRIGIKVFDGTETWGMALSEPLKAFSTTISDIKYIKTGTTGTTNILSNIYQIQTKFVPFHQINFIDKSIGRGNNGGLQYSNITVVDSSFESSADFKQHIQELYAAGNPLILLYELETPVVVEFTEPLNLNYRVSDFGTETLLPINGATPITTAINMDVKYGLNVVDTVRNLSRNYLGMTGTQNTFAVIVSALAAYGISMTLGDYDETNKYYPVTISGGWKPANAVPASATAAGSRGEYYIDTEYFYVCVDDATWKRFALSAW